MDYNSSPLSAPLAVKNLLAEMESMLAHQNWKGPTKLPLRAVLTEYFTKMRSSGGNSVNFKSST